MWFSLYTNKSWWAFIVRGMLIILTGMVIFIFPQILVAMISGLLFMIGSFIIGHGLYVRKLKKESEPVKVKIF